MKKYGGFALIAALVFGLLFVVTGTRECGPVPAGISEDSASALISSGDTLRAIDPRMGTEAAQFVCVGGWGENWLFAVLGGAMLLAALGFLVDDWIRKLKARDDAPPAARTYVNGAWTCSHCGHINFADAVTCIQCNRRRYA